METPETTPQTLPATTTPGAFVSIYANDVSFAHGQRIAKALSSSTMVPTTYQGATGMSNCLVALEMANRMNLSPLAVMQNLDIIHGRPSWKSSFIISAINSSGKFSPLRFKTTGEGDAKTCYAYATDRESGETVTGPPISISTAKAEKWYSRTGSKWPTMPDLMLMYRAATLFGRLYVPEILNGMPTAEETFDVGYETVSTGPAKLDKLNSKLSAKPVPAPKPEPKPEPEFEDAIEVGDELGI